MRDVYQFNKTPDKASTLNFVTCSKVFENEPGTLLLQGEDFMLELKYDAKSVTPKIEFTEVTDSGLKRYWPNGITRIVLTLNNLKANGKNKITIIKK